jgi:hypothetical protein
MIRTDPAVLSARRFSRAWGNVALATIEDDDHPLHRSMLVESYDYRGVRLVTTNNYLLLRSWVSTDWEPEPDEDEVPDETVVVLDADNRAGALMKYLRSLTKKAEDPDEELRLLVRHESADDNGGQLTLGGNLAGEIAVFGIDLEQVALPTFEGSFFDWRRAELPTAPSESNTAGIGPDTLARLGKIGFVSGLVFDYSDARTVRFKADVQDQQSPTLDGVFARYKPEST